MSWWQRYREGWKNYIGAPGSPQRQATGAALRQAGLALLQNSMTDPNRGLVEAVGAYHSTRASEFDRIDALMRQAELAQEERRRRDSQEAREEERLSLARRRQEVAEVTARRQEEDATRARVERANQIEENKKLAPKLGPYADVAEIFADDPGKFASLAAKAASDAARADREKNKKPPAPRKENPITEVTYDGTRYGIDKKSGEVRWATPLGEKKKGAQGPSFAQQAAYERSQFNAYISNGLPPEEASRLAKKATEARYGAPAAATSPAALPSTGSPISRVVQQMATSLGDPDLPARFAALVEEEKRKGAVTPGQAEGRALSILQGLYGAGR